MRESGPQNLVRDNNIVRVLMKRVLCSVVMILVSQIAIAKGIECPKGTTPNGETTPEVSEAWCEDLNHKMHGPYRAWWPNGKLGTEGEYDHGKATGKWRGWYESGQLQGEEWFENGKKTKGNYYDKQGNERTEP